MVALAAGAVVLVPFPFSDLSKSKLRPAVVLADAGRGDWILCQVTSKPYADSLSIALSERSFAKGTLERMSFVRPGKLFTGSSDLIVKEVGMLEEAVLHSILHTVRRVLGRPARPSVTATLSVRDWPRAMEFYKAAFRATEVFRVPGGGVGTLSVSGAEFWVAEESPEHLNFSPQSLGGCSVRMLLIVEDPATVCAEAIAAGAKQVVPVADRYGWLLGRIVDPFGHHWEIGKPSR